MLSKIENLFSSRRKKIVIFAALDAFLIYIAVWLAFFLRFDAKIPSFYYDTIEKVSFLLILFNVPLFYFSGLYHFSFSYVSVKEAISLLKAVFISFLFVTITLYFSQYFPGFKGFPRSTLVVSFFLTLFFCASLRFSKRIYSDVFKMQKGVSKKRLLIIGAGDAGEQIARSVMSSNYYDLAAFIDDSKAKQGIAIHGIKVLGEINDAPRIAKSLGIQEIIIALPSAGSKAIKKAVEKGREAGVKKIRIVPSINEVIGGQVSLKDVRDAQAEDLLGREEIILDTASIENFIKGKIVLITGAAGSIGSEICRQTARFGPSLVLLLDQDETGIFNISNELKEKFPFLKINSIIADIADEKKMEEVFKRFFPHIVFHAAAYKHVPLMEENCDQAVNNNIFGTKIVGEKALKYGASKFVFISTDKAVNPSSIMGATKRLGEMVCSSLNGKGKTKFISVRFGNVLDSRGSVIPIFREQIRKGGPLTVTHPEMKRYFMLVSEAVLLVLEAGALGKGGEIFVLDMGKPISILELAKEMIKFSGLDPDKDIPIVFTEPRPGEKLFEEILTAEEGTLSTKYDKIFVAKMPQKIKGSQLKSLQGASKEEAVKIFKKIIPTYGARN